MKHPFRFITLCIVSLYLALSPALLRGVSSAVVISQVYGGGGNAGATYTNDFIQLFNFSGSAVSLAGWSVQYASATGTAWQVTPLSGTIGPGHYFLIQEAAGSGGTTALPTPDATGTIAMSATAGKVALVSSTAALSGACPAGVVDFVGFGATANCFEGSGAAPGLSNTTAAIRLNGGATETDNNSADFTAGPPVPANSLGIPPSGTASATPNSGGIGTSTLLTVAVTPGSGPASSGLTVTGNLTPIGGAASQPLYDDGTHGDVAASDKTFSYSALVAGGAVPGAQLLSFAIADAQTRTATASTTFTVSGVVTPTLVISQVYGGGGNAGATLKNDYVEIYNLGTTIVSVSGWSIQYASAAGTSWQVTALNGVIPPGRYYLVQEAQGAGGTTDLPPPDAIGTIAMAAGSGKIALVNNSTSLSGACPVVGLVDLVGYGTANCSETAPTPALSNTTAALRKNDGATDTNNNLADFIVDAPNPHNSQGFPPTGTGAAVPASAAPGETVAFTVTVTPGKFPPAGGLAVVADLSSVGGSATETFFDDGINGSDALAGDNLFTFSLALGGGAAQGPRNLPATVSDALTRSTTTTIPFSVEAPGTPIHTIQGATSTSAHLGQFVTTPGIVTGVKSNGFFMQTPDADIDGDSATSEGIFVFTGGPPPPAAAVGNYVKASGTVTEFIPSADPISPSITEIGGGGTPTPAVRFATSSNPLPGPVNLTSADTDPAGSQEQLERYEGMRVHVDLLRVIAPTQAAFVDEQNAISTTNGVFYGVIDGIPRPLREPGIEVPDPLPAGTPCCVPRFDANPERLRVDSDGQVGATPIEVSAGALVSNLTGPLDYTFRTYMILPDPATPPIVSGLISAIPVPAPDVNEFTVAAFNMERFFDTSDDPGVDDVVLTPAAFDKRLAKASLAIRNVMQSPDIVGIEEVDNLPTIQAIATRLNADTVTAGQPNPMYEGFLEDGNDIGGIDIGVLIKTSRVTLVDLTQVGKTATYLPPGSTVPALLNDRPSIVVRVEVQSPLGTTFPLTVIVNHLRSLSGIDGPDGDRIRAKRRAQAEFLANVIQARQIASPTERIVSVGDYNAFQFSDGYADVIGTIKGAPTAPDQVVLSSPDLVNPNLVNLVETLPPGERYSFSFDGNGQILDHVLVNTALMGRFSRFHFARNDADFPESLRGDAARPERISDHDMPVAYFSFAKAPILTLNGANPMTVECHAPFVDPGATATDEDLGDITARIVVTGSVDTSTPGTYTLTYSVSNGILTTTRTRTVVVADTTPPSLSAPTVSTSNLWPPNHAMVDITVSYGASDTCSAVTCSLSVTSSEAANGSGDGDTSVDWEVVDPHHVRLRAERSGQGKGRVYTIAVRCLDASGNATVRTVTVTVAK